MGVQGCSEGTEVVEKEGQRGDWGLRRQAHVPPDRRPRSMHEKNCGGATVGGSASFQSLQAGVVLPHHHWFARRLSDY